MNVCTYQAVCISVHSVHCAVYSAVKLVKQVICVYYWPDTNHSLIENKFIISDKMSLARSSLFTNLVKRSFCTSSSPNITTEVDKHGIATVSLNKGPVNTFNMEMIQGNKLYVKFVILYIFFLFRNLLK